VVRFTVVVDVGSPIVSPKVGRGSQFTCLCCGSVTSEHYVRNEGMDGHIGTQLMAIVAEGKQGRIYLSPTSEQEVVASQARPEWRPEQEISNNTRWFSPPVYGMSNAYSRHFLGNNKMSFVRTVKVGTDPLGKLASRKQFI